MVICEKTRLRGEVPSADGGVISGWKDIATYLQKGVRTVQRYERQMGLPVRRPAGKSAGSVMATKAELDSWLVASPIREAFRMHQAPVDIATPLREFRWQLKELRRLREDTAELRVGLKTTLQLLQTNLHFALSERDQTYEGSPRPRLVADVLAFHAKREVD
jgi:hypothetical protein